MLTSPILVQFGWKMCGGQEWTAERKSRVFFLSNYPNHPTPTPPPPPLTTPKYKFCQFCSNLDKTWCRSKEWIAKLKSRFILFIWLPQITPTTLSPTPLTQLKILTKMGKLGTWNGQVGGLKWRYWGPEMDKLGAWNGQVGGLKSVERERFWDTKCWAILNEKEDNVNGRYSSI